MLVKHKRLKRCFRYVIERCLCTIQKPVWNFILNMHLHEGIDLINLDTNSHRADLLVVTDND